jgi:hypothetical protein
MSLRTLKCIIRLVRLSLFILSYFFRYYAFLLRIPDCRFSCFDVAFDRNLFLSIVVIGSLPMKAKLIFFVSQKVLVFLVVSFSRVHFKIILRKHAYHSPYI